MGIYYGYARVSTEEQHDTSITVQINKLKANAKALGMTFKPFSEKKSGKDVEGRTVFKEVLGLLKEGDYLGVYDNSRLGRNTNDNLNIADQLTERGVTIQVGSDIYDPHDPDSIFMFEVSSVLSAYHRRIIRKRSISGLAEKKMNGEWIMTGKLFGYDLVKRGNLTIVKVNEDEAQYIRTAYEKYAEGKSFYWIEKYFENIKARLRIKLTACNLRKICYKPIYMGYYMDESGLTDKIPTMTEDNVRKHLIKSKFYQPIVSEELWWSVFKSWRLLKRSRSRQYEYRHSAYELSGIVKCGVCGKGFAHSYSKWDNTYGEAVSEVYVCNVHRPDCTNRFYRTFDCESLEFCFQAMFLATVSFTGEVSKFWEKKLLTLTNDTASLWNQGKELEKEYYALKKKKDRLLDLYLEGVLSKTDYAERCAPMEADMQALDDDMKEVAEAWAESKHDIDDCYVEQTEDLLDTFSHVDMETRRQLYIKYIESAKVFHDTMEVTFINGKKYILDFADKYSRIRNEWHFTMYLNENFQAEGVMDSQLREIRFDFPEETDIFKLYTYNMYRSVASSVTRLLKEMDPLWIAYKNGEL